MVDVWPFKPNWSESVVERLEWATNVLTSVTGAEQRSSARLSPRRTFEFMVSNAYEDRTYFDNYMQVRGADTWWMPVWFNRAKVEEEVPAGSVEIPVDARFKEFIGNSTVIVYIGDRPFKLSVLRVEEDRLILKTATTRVIPARSVVYPALLARLDEQPGSIYRHAAVAMASSVRFIVVQSNELITGKTGWGFNWGYQWGRNLTLDVNGWGYGWGMGWGGFNYLTDENTLEGTAVITTPPDEAERLTYGYQRMINRIDNRSGIPYQRDAAGRAFRFQQHRWFLKGDEKMMEFRRLLYRLRGKTKTVWLPTFVRDFTLAFDVPAGVGQFFAKKTFYGDLKANIFDRDGLQISRSDGTISHHRIVEAVSASDDYDLLTITPALDRSLSVSEVRRISLMGRVRLEQDAVEIDHPVDTVGVSTAVTTFRDAPKIRKVIA
jgi:hypothetical protein